MAISSNTGDSVSEASFAVPYQQRGAVGFIAPVGGRESTAGAYRLHRGWCAPTVESGTSISGSGGGGGCIPALEIPASVGGSGAGTSAIGRLGSRISGIQGQPRSSRQAGQLEYSRNFPLMDPSISKHHRFGPSERKGLAPQHGDRLHSSWPDGSVQLRRAHSCGEADAAAPQRIDRPGHQPRRPDAHFSSVGSPSRRAAVSRATRLTSSHSRSRGCGQAARRICSSIILAQSVPFRTMTGAQGARIAIPRYAERVGDDRAVQSPRQQQPTAADGPAIGSADRAGRSGDTRQAGGLLPGPRARLSKCGMKPTAAPAVRRQARHQRQQHRRIAQCQPAGSPSGARCAGPRPSGSPSSDRGCGFGDNRRSRCRRPVSHCPAGGAHRAPTPMPKQAYARILIEEVRQQVRPQQRVQFVAEVRRARPATERISGYLHSVPRRRPVLTCDPKAPG